MSPSPRRTVAERATLMRRLGTDIALTFAGPAGTFDDADIATDATTALGADTDVALATGVEAARQMLVNRILTRRGELAALGHPKYGSRHHELIGQPNTERTRNLIKLHVLECLRQEPRVAKVVRCDVVAFERHRDIVRLEVDIRLIDEPNPLNLVIPIELV